MILFPSRVATNMHRGPDGKDLSMMRHTLATAVMHWLARLLMSACMVAVSAQAVEMAGRGNGKSLSEMQQVVATAAERASYWDGPQAGPAGRVGMTVSVLCEDLRNGGVLGVARGIEEAASVLGWRIEIIDAHGSDEGRSQAIAAALALNPEGVILVGSDAKILASRLSPFATRGVPMVGWHVAAHAGRMPGSVAMNVSTDPLEVAKVAAMAAIVESGGKAGVVIFTDSNFEIAMAKANAMGAEVRKCKECTLLEVRAVPISRSAQLMPGETQALLKKYGARWTHALAINDIYFDYLSPELARAGQDVRLYSAGDGSPSAFLRIQADTFQAGTVAEPLNQQGWQLVDELNRLLANSPVSGYIMPVHLVTHDNIRFDGGPHLLFDPDNGYRQIYRRIWKR